MEATTGPRAGARLAWALPHVRAQTQQALPVFTKYKVRPEQRGHGGSKPTRGLPG